MVNQEIKKQLMSKTHHTISIIRIQHRNRTSNTIYKTYTIIINITSYFPRKYREAIEIQKYSNNLNRDNGYNINKIKPFSGY